MEQQNSDNKISRRKFLLQCGAILAGGSIVGLTGFLFHKNLINPNGAHPQNGTAQREDHLLSPYRQMSSFKVPDAIEAFELTGDRIIVAASNTVYIYDTAGNLTNNFAVGSNLRDVVADDEHIYLLFPTRIEVYKSDGEWLRDWEACSDQSDYCSMAVTPEAVFVTDASNKNICQYTKEGGFIRFIQSPDGFIIPSYSFGITYTNDVIYCSNPGRHKVEKYTTNGEYVGSFGKSGGAAGMFCGCCNPVYLAYTPTGDILTSEKGNPRISCYSTDGEFRSILLDSKALGGGNAAYDIKNQKDKLFVAGKDVVSIFQYDRSLAAKTACSDCKVNCPLKEGVSL